VVCDATRCLEGKAPIIGLKLIRRHLPLAEPQENPAMPYSRLDLAKPYREPSATSRLACAVSMLK
jgi:hypothetical protein